MSGNGIGNIDIENIFSNEENDDLKKNYMGVYSSNNLTRYISFHDVISEKKMQNINLQFLIQIETINQEHIGGFFLDIHPKKICFYLIV